MDHYYNIRLSRSSTLRGMQHFSQIQHFSTDTTFPTDAAFLKRIQHSYDSGSIPQADAAFFDRHSIPRSGKLFFCLRINQLIKTK